MGLHRVLVQDQALHFYGLASMISLCCSTLVLLELVSAPTHLPAGCCVIVQRDRRWRRRCPAATFLHRCDLHALAGCLQTALSAIVALASALATHHQPPKCAALSSHPFAICLVCRQTERRAICSQLCKRFPRCVSRRTHPSFLRSFHPSFVVSCIASPDCSACSPLPLAHPRSTLEPMPITTEAHRQLKSKAVGSSPSSTRTG
jgi:hypothetical protein